MLRPHTQICIRRACKARCTYGQHGADCNCPRNTSRRSWQIQHTIQCSVASIIEGHTGVIIALVCTRKRAAAKRWIDGFVKRLKAVVAQPLAACPLQSDKRGATVAGQLACLPSLTWLTTASQPSKQAVPSQRSTIWMLQKSKACVLSLCICIAGIHKNLQPRIISCAQLTFIRVPQSTPFHPAGQRHQPVEASHTPARRQGHTLALFRNRRWCRQVAAATAAAD